MPDVIKDYMRGKLTLQEGQNLFDSELRGLEVQKNLLHVLDGLLMHRRIFKELGYNYESEPIRLFTDVCLN